jgi:hypothetical protein
MLAEKALTLPLADLASSHWKDGRMDYNRATFHWMPVGRESVLECASVLALFRDQARDCQLESAKTLAHSKTLSRPTGFIFHSPLK